MEGRESVSNLRHGGRVLEFGVNTAFCVGRTTQMDSLSFKKMDFPEFCAAATSVHQLEGTDRWERHARAAYDIFEKEGNRVISVEELTRVCSLNPPLRRCQLRS